MNCNCWRWKETNCRLKQNTLAHMQLRTYLHIFIMWGKCLVTLETLRPRPENKQSNLYDHTWTVVTVISTRTVMAHYFTAVWYTNSLLTLTYRNGDCTVIVNMSCCWICVCVCVYLSVKWQWISFRKHSSFSHTAVKKIERRRHDAENWTIRQRCCSYRSHHTECAVIVNMRPLLPRLSVCVCVCVLWLNRNTRA